MKLCKNGHVRGTVDSCRPCQISNYVKKRWTTPSFAMTCAAKTSITRLQTQTAQTKRRIYFNSAKHKSLASTQAKNQAIKRRLEKRPLCIIKRDTKPELAVEEAIKSLNIPYRAQEPVGPYLFDFYLPDHKLLIEVDGEYWHSLQNSIANDLAKETYVSTQCPDIGLLRFRELDTYKRGYVSKQLRAKTGSRQPVVNINFDDLQLSTCNTSIAERFLSAYHYLPRFRKTMRVIHAIKHVDNVIGIIVYATPSYGSVAKKYSYRPSEVLELSRFVIGDEYHIRNLASWAISRSVLAIKSELPNIKFLVSYADPHFGFDGAIYKASNWDQAGSTQPGYYYISNDKSILHKKTIWDHAKKMGKPEIEYAESAGLIRIECEPKLIFTYEIATPSITGKRAAKSVNTNCKSCKHEHIISRQAFGRAVRKYGHYLCLSCTIKINWKNGCYNKRPKRIEVTFNEKVSVFCRCGKQAAINKKSLEYAIRHHGKYRCISCGMKEAKGQTL